MLVRLEPGLKPELLTENLAAPRRDLVENKPALGIGLSREVKTDKGVAATGLIVTENVVVSDDAFIGGRLSFQDNSTFDPAPRLEDDLSLLVRAPARNSA